MFETWNTNELDQVYQYSDSNLSTYSFLVDGTRTVTPLRGQIKIFNSSYIGSSKVPSLDLYLP